MGVLLRNELRRLCTESGWYYAVFWRAIGFCTPLHLVWEDGHCETPTSISGVAQISGNGQTEDRGAMLVKKTMTSQVHVVGDGIVGQAALTERYQWIIRDTLDGLALEGFAEMNPQFLAGIQTIAIIPVLPFGVVQLGSAQLIMENIELIDSVKCLISQLGNVHWAALPDAKALCKTSRAHALPALDYHFSSEIRHCGPVVRLNHKASGYSSCNGLENNSSGATSSNCGPVENEPTINDCKQLQLIPGACESPEPLIVLDVGRKEPLVDAMALGDTSSFPVNIKVRLKIPSGILSGSGTLCLSDVTKNPNNHQVISEDPLSAKPSKKNNRNIVVAGKQKQENNFFQAIDVLPSEFAEPSPCYDSVIGSETQCQITSSDPSKQIYLSHEIGTETFANSQNKTPEKAEQLDVMDEKSSLLPMQPSSRNDLFEALGSEYKSSICGRSNVIAHRNLVNALELDLDVPTCPTHLGVGPFSDMLNYDSSTTAIFSDNYDDQLLDAVVTKAQSAANQSSDDSVLCKTSVTKTSSSSLHMKASPSVRVTSSEQIESELLGHVPMLLGTEIMISNFARSSCCTDITEECSIRSESYKSQIIPCFHNDQNPKCDSTSSAQCTGVSYVGRLTRKRARPGEVSRPRPKDRQMIQDHVKELRKIVPNGARCSIEALLEKTIKHMLFLRSVLKDANKLKETADRQEGGLVWKNNFDNCVTWALGVGTQSMNCPIVVKDLWLPRQMLVEMLCEEQGFFLEIADHIKGLGLTILKGVMKACKDKVWACFAVESNLDITRMEIFFLLLRLMEPTAGSQITPISADNFTMPQPQKSDCLC